MTMPAGNDRFNPAKRGFWVDGYSRWFKRPAALRRDISNCLYFAIAPGCTNDGSRPTLQKCNLYCVDAQLTRINF
jgi:hypothetical protein